MLGGGWSESIHGPWNVEPPAWAPKQGERSGQYPHTAPKEHIYKSLRFVHSPMSPFILKQVYKKFTTLVYLSSSTMNLQAKIGVYKAVNSCK